MPRPRIQHDHGPPPNPASSGGPAPSPQPAAALTQLPALAALAGHPATLILQGATTISLNLPAPTVDALLELLSAAAAGQAVSVVRQPAELSTQQAAELLGVSRPHLIKQINAGLLPARMVGTHRRLATADVLAFRERTSATRRAALDELTGTSQSLGLGESQTQAACNCR